MLNFLTIMGTKVVGKTLTKPMKILNVIKNLLTLFGLILLVMMSLVIVEMTGINLNDKTALYSQSLYINYALLFGSISLIVIPAIQFVVRYFTTLNMPLTKKQSDKLAIKLMKREWKLSVKSNKIVNKKLDKLNKQKESK